MHIQLFLTGNNCLATATLARAGTGVADDRGFDATIRRKLAEIEPPIGLHDAILAQEAVALGNSSRRRRLNDGPDRG